MKKKYYKNKCRCKMCGEVIESRYRHHFVACSCGACYTDGGIEYCRRGWDSKCGTIEDVIENIVEEIKPDEYKVYGIKEAV